MTQTLTEWMTAREFATHMGVSPQAVYKAIADGRTPVERGRIRVQEAEAMWRATTRPSATGAVTGDPGAGGAPESRGPNYHHARAVRETIRARREQLELDELLGRKIDADQVRLAQFELGRRTRDAIDAMFSRVSARLVGKPRREIERILREENRRVMDGLSSTPLERPTDAAGASAGAAS